jgi:hypothetical protein
MPSIFGGNSSFGKPIPMNRAPGQGALPVVKPGQQPTAAHSGGPNLLGVVPPPPPGSVMGPQGPVPMGAKKDCPICRG